MSSPSSSRALSALSSLSSLSSPTQRRDQGLYDPIYKDGDTLKDQFLAFRRRIRETQHVLLHWDNSKKELVPWEWPTDENGDPIHPVNFPDYRRTHFFLYPSCLCAMNSDSPDAYREVVVAPGTKGGLIGKWIARCPITTKSKSCGYYVPLEFFYKRLSVPLRCYPPLPNVQGLGTGLTSGSVPSQDNIAVDSSQLAPGPSNSNIPATPVQKGKRKISVISPSFASDASVGNKRAKLEDGRAVPLSPKDVRQIPGQTSTSIADVSPYRLLLRLDREMVSFEQFSKLFVRCKFCKSVGTHDALDDHICDKGFLLRTTEEDIIDISSDSD